jgi:hypothetical protein
MLAFVVPLKSARISRDWSLASRLFERCLRAICNQTSHAFRVVVVCNERPETSFCHPHVHYVEVDFPPPFPDPTEEQTHGYELARSKYIARQNADKARKILAGLEYAGRFGPTHSMVVDADDCVSNELAEFVAQNPTGAGWYLKKGYFHTEGSRFVFLNRQNFNVVCGSSVIIAYSQRQVLFSAPDFYQHAFDDPPAGVVPLPFIGAVYSMANGDNIYMSAQTRDHIYTTLLKRLFSPRIFATMWKVVNHWPTLLTEARRQEFGLYRLGEPGAAPVEKRTLEAVAS